jgi:HK97 family phage major capsid protein
MDAEETPRDRSGIPGVNYREMDLSVDRERLETRAEGDDRVPIAISSEAPVERYDWWTGERYNEILDHSASAVDLTYARDGFPFLVDHETRDMVGLVEDVALGKDRKLRGMVRFSRSVRAQEVRQDIVDEIRKKISVGYRIDEDNVERTKKSGDAIATVRVKRWTPLEASSVPIPADYEVGVGRSADGAAPRPRLATTPRSHHAAAKAEETTVEKEKDTTATATSEAAATIDPTPTVQRSAATPNAQGRSGNGAEEERIDALSALADEFKMHDRLRGWLTSGRSIQDVQTEVIKEIRERLAKGPTFAAPVNLTEKEQREYSFTRAIMASAFPQDPKYRNCFEVEVAQEIGRVIASRGYQGQGGILVPTNIRSYYEVGRDLLQPPRTRAGLDSATGGSGGELKFDVPGTFIDLLRNRARVLQLGATVLAGLDAPVTFPKQSSAGTASWMGENPGSPVSITALGTTTVTLAPKTLMSTTKFSRQLTRLSVVDVENLVRADLAAIHALAIDLAAINGSGSSNQPLGIIPNTSVNVVTLGTNGGVPTYDSMVDLEIAVEDDNADIGAAGYLTTPSVKGKLKKTQVFPTTNGVAVWTGGQNGVVNGYPAFSTKQVPSNLTKGTSTTVCHAVVYGVWAQLLMGEFGAMELVADPYTLAASAMIVVTSYQMVDIALRYPEAFAVIKDALP